MGAALDDDSLEAPWQELRAHWDDPAAHRRFVNRAALEDRLPEAGRRYREARGEKDLAPRAAEGLDLVLGAALAKLKPTPREEKPSVLVWVAPLAALAALFTATTAAAQLLHRPSLASPSVLAVEVALVALVPWSRLRGGA
ncbi:MAG: hypothetical protein HY909_10210 [Deltaproteobacteria bacterium]|nr:hypothetical protein [Deltaproteobacteria bacterium]